MTNSRGPSGSASLGIMPLSPDYRSDQQSLAAMCREIALAGDAISGKEQHFCAGDNFLGLVNFMGCSPHVEFTATSPDSAFTHIVLHALEQPILFHGRHTRPPRCPRCGRAMREWQQAIDHGMRELACEHCGRQSPIGDVDWRRTAGHAATVIEITEIFPREAQPQSGLLQRLQQHSGVDWTYFYF